MPPPDTTPPVTAPITEPEPMPTVAPDESMSIDRNAPFRDEFAGQRVVVSVDGGRVRIREGGQRGRRGKKGRRRFRTPWCEPKLVTAYVIDEEGHKVRSVRSPLDATMARRASQRRDRTIPAQHSSPRDRWSGGFRRRALSAAHIRV